MKNIFIAFLIFFGTATYGLAQNKEADSSQPGLSVKLSSQRAIRSPDWIKEAIIYKVFLRSFSDEGKIYNLEKRILELKSFGYNAISLMPFFPMEKIRGMENLGNPYIVKDFYGVDIEFGTKDAFKALIQEAHLNGVGIILNWPMSQISKEHPIAKEHPEWLMSSSTTSPEISPVLNYNEPPLQDYLIQAMIDWINEYNIDGLEFEKADSAPISFWEKVRRELSKIKPSIVLIGGENPKYHAGVFDATYSKKFQTLLKKTVQGESDADEIKNYLDQEKMDFPQESLRIRFIENENTTRSIRNFGDAHFSVAALILTMEGIPLIFNGQELGETDEFFLSEKRPIRWAEGRKNNQSIIKFYKKLLDLRKEHPSFSKGQTFQLLTSNNKQVVAFARSYREDAVLIAINLSKNEFNGNIEIPEIFRDEKGFFKMKSEFPDISPKSKKDDFTELTLPPWGFQVWTMK